MRNELMSAFPELQEKGGVSIATVWKFLVNEIGFTLKRTKPVEGKRNNPQQLQRRNDFVMKTL